MKKYKINSAYLTNKKTSKNGILWQYRGEKTLEEAKEKIVAFEDGIENAKKFRDLGYCVAVGLRVTDTETGEVIYEKLI